MIQIVFAILSLVLSYIPTVYINNIWLNKIFTQDDNCPNPFLDTHTGITTAVICDRVAPPRLIIANIIVFIVMTSIFFLFINYFSLYIQKIKQNLNK